MKIEQISVFLENKSGRLARVTRVLGENNINIRALSIADTTDFGILRLIVNDSAKAFTVLKEAGFTLSVTEVVAVEVPDQPGGLASVLEVLKGAGINIEYLYAFLQKATSAALVVLRVEQPDSAIKILVEHGVRIVPADEVYSL